MRHPSWMLWVGVLSWLGACASEQSSASEAPAGARASGGEGPHAVVGLPHEQHPADDLITGGAPDLQALQQARAQGVDLVISLQATDEPGALDEANQVQTLGMRFVRIPVAGAQGLTQDNAARLHEVLQQNPEARIILHCSSGNRTGALLALRAFYFEDASVEEALALGRRAGLTRLEPVVRERLREACEREPDPDRC